MKPCGQGPLNLGKPAQAGMRAHIQGYVATHSGRVAATQTEPRVAQRYDRLVAVLQRPQKVCKVVEAPSVAQDEPGVQRRPPEVILPGSTTRLPGTCPWWPERRTELVNRYSLISPLCCG